MREQTKPIVVSHKDWQDLIGIQFALGGTDPKLGLNCYGLVREVYKGLQVELPARQAAELDGELLDSCAGMDWTRLEEPQAYAVALIRSNQGDNCFHLAVVTPELTLLHALPRKGVVVSPLERYSDRLVGFYRYTPGSGERLPVAEGDIGRIFGAILITIAAVAAAVLTYGALTPGSAVWVAAAWAAAAGSAVSITGNLVMNAIAPVRQDLPQLSGYLGDLGDSRTYTWDGIVNDARQGLVKAMILGRIKVGGQIIAEKTWFDGSGNEYLDMLICPAFGRITRFMGLQVNDTGIQLYKNTGAVYRPGDDQQPPIEMFDRLYVQYTSSAKLPYASSTTDPANALQFSTKEVLTGIRITLVAPYGLFYMPESTALPQTVAFKVQYRPTAGGAWADLPTVDLDLGGDVPFMNRTFGAFTRSANPFLVSDARAGFTSSIHLNGIFELTIGSTKYYCRQAGSIGEDSMEFDAFTDEGRTTPVAAPLNSGPYVISAAEVRAFTGPISLYEPDPPRGPGH